MSDFTRCFFISFITAAATSIVVYVVMSRLEENRFAPPAPGAAVAPQTSAARAPVPPAPPATVPAAVTLAAAPRSAEVPRLVGVATDDAKQILKERGLLLVMEAQRPDEAVPAGHVLSQSPLPGSELKLGGAVRVTLSTGAPPVELPNVEGMALETARAQLEGAGLSIGPVTARPDDRPQGQVLATRPAAGREVARGTSVELVVSGGPVEVEVPRVTRRTIGVARRVLRDAGLEPSNITWTYNQDYEPGIIVRQKPKAGATVPKGSTIRLWGSEPDE